MAHNGAAIFGGAERWTVRLLADLRERGHDVLFLCRDEEIREQAEARGVPARVAHLGGHVALHDAVRFAALLRGLRPDGLLLSTFKKTWLGGLGARLAGVPRVVARIGLSTDRPGRRFVYRMAFRRWIDRVVVNADNLRAGVLEDLPGFPPRRVVTLYNGVRAPTLSKPPGSVRRELGLEPDVPVVGTVARLVDQKRLDRLVRVVAALSPDTHCVVAGDGPERASLEALATTFDVADRVHFLGHRDDVGDVLDALDLFAVTSDKEGMSNAMLEALSAGVPVVSTRVSGAEEALSPVEAMEGVDEEFGGGEGEVDGVPPGRVVSPAVDDLARAVAALLGDREHLGRMSRAASLRARRRFDQDDKVSRWERLLARDVQADVHDGPSPLDGLPA